MFLPWRERLGSENDLLDRAVRRCGSRLGLSRTHHFAEVGCVGHSGRSAGVTHAGASMRPPRLPTARVQSAWCPGSHTRVVHPRLHHHPPSLRAVPGIPPGEACLTAPAGCRSVWVARSRPRGLPVTPRDCPRGCTVTCPWGFTSHSLSDQCCWTPLHALLCSF